MKITLKEILDSGSMSASSVNSIGLLVDQMFCGSIQANWSNGSNTPSGTLKIQGSNDDVAVKAEAAVNNTPMSQFVGSDPAGNVTHWADISGATASISGNSGSAMINLSVIGYKWLRAVYTKSSGEGSIDIRFFGKG